MRKLLFATAAILAIPTALALIAKARKHHAPPPDRATATAIRFPEQWIPDAALVVAEFGQTDEILDVLFSPAAARLFQETPGLSRPQSPGQRLGLWMFRQHFERKFGAGWQDLARRLVRGGLTIAVGGEKIFVAIAKGEDAAFVQALHDELVAVSRRGEKREPGKASEKRYGDVAIWTLNAGETYHAVVDGHLILSNRLPAIQAALDLRAGTGGRSLAEVAEFQAAKRATGTGSAAALYVSPAISSNLSAAKGRQRLRENPLASLLLAPYVDGFRDSGWTAIELDCDGGGITLRLNGTGGPKRDGPRAFAWPAGNDGALPHLEVPRQLASLSVYRDLRDFYSNKDALFPERTSQLIFFENMMGIFFSGRDIAEDVMGAVDPHARLIVAGQAYDPAIGTPSTQIPAVALVFRMRQPDRFGLVAEEAWQKMLGLVNFTRGQKAEPGLIIDRLEHAGVRYSCAAFSHAEEKDRNNLDIRFNFRPSVAYHRGFLIFSTTNGLANDLIDAIKKPPAKPVAGINGLLRIDGTRLASLIAANREPLIRDNMVKKGQTREEAEKGVAVLAAIARTLGTTTLRAGAPEGKMIAELAVSLNAKPPAASVASANPP